MRSSQSGTRDLTCNSETEKIDHIGNDDTAGRNMGLIIDRQIMATHSESKVHVGEGNLQQRVPVKCKEFVGISIYNFIPVSLQP